MSLIFTIHWGFLYSIETVNILMVLCVYKIQENLKLCYIFTKSNSFLTLTKFSIAAKCFKCFSLMDLHLKIDCLDITAKLR